MRSLFEAKARATWAHIREDQPVPESLLSPLPPRRGAVDAMSSPAADAPPLRERLADVVAALGSAAQRGGPAAALVAACSVASLQQQRPGSFATLLLALMAAAAVFAVMSGAHRRLLVRK